MSSNSDATVQNGSEAISPMPAVFQSGGERQIGWEELNASEQRFRAFAENLPQLAWMADRTGSLFWYNRRWFDYTGTTLDEMLGWGWQKVHRPDFVDVVTEKFRAHVASGEPWEDTFPLKGVDGQYRWFLSRAIPVCDTAGNVVLWCGTNTDITDQRETAAALRRAEECVRALYELTARNDLGFTEKVRELLYAGRNWLGLDISVLARTDCDAGLYEIAQIDAAGETPPVGFTCPLNQTFCSETVKLGPGSPPLAVEAAGAIQLWRDHPAYKAFGTEAYLAAVVWANGKVWGTLSFLSKTQRLIPFTAFDIDMVRLIAQWTGGEIARQEAEAATTRQQRRFVREMLASVTEGKLCLCESQQDLPVPLPLASDTIDLTAATLRVLRRRVEAVAAEVSMPHERIHDILTAVGEAAMNAVKYGGGGQGHVCADRDKRAMQVWIYDQGAGIRDEDLHRATLEKGWSGAGSLGHGFYLMLRTADRTYLLTGSKGTTVVLEQASEPAEPTWLDVR